MRGFRCIPVALKYSPVMAQLTTFERDVIFSSLIAQDDRHCLPYDAATLRSEIFPTRAYVAVSEIAKARDRLVAFGVFKRKTSPRKEWLEIAEDYRHTEGRLETSFGDEESAHQTELSLGPMLFEPEPARAKPPARAPALPRAKKINGSRADSEQSRYTDSRARAPVRAVPGTPAPPGNQELRAGKESGSRFARDESAEDDPLWSELSRALGLSEMVQHGALWLKRFRLCRDAINAALSDWKAMRPESRKLYTPAAYLTVAFENEHRRAG